jgi:hypothetical protein
MAPPRPKFNPPTFDTPERQTLNLPPRLADGETVFTLPGGRGSIPPTLPPGIPPLIDQHAWLLPPAPIAEQAIRISDGAALPATDLPTLDPLDTYRVSTHSRDLLPVPNTEGMRVYARRQYADLEDATTVQVDWDEGTQTYRAKRPNESTASGPSLYLNGDRKTWSMGLSQNESKTAELMVRQPSENVIPTPPVAKRPRPDQTDPPQQDAALSYVNTDHYVWNESTSNHHGYVVMHRQRGLDSSAGPQVRFAFRDENGSFIGVEPSANLVNEPAQQLAAWTDRDLWDFYGIHGSDITRFRAEASSTGKKPQWAEPRAQRLENTYLFDELRRWTAPDMDRDMFINTLKALNYTPLQLAKKLDNVSLHWKVSHLTTASSSVPPSTPLLAPGSNVRVPGFGDPAHYYWDNARTTFQGYVELHRKTGLNDSHGPAIQLAFSDGPRLVRVQPTGYSTHQPAPYRPNWRDFDIWNLYRIEGDCIVRFRREVALNGKPPQWVKPREYPSQREQLMDYLRLWTSPDTRPVSPPDFIARLRHHNFSTEQLSQLCDELTTTGQFPHRLNNELPRWAEAHRRSALDETNSRRFEPFLEEIRGEIIRLRNHGDGYSALQAHLAPRFFKGLLNRIGYQRNIHNCLFRTDIPVMFRGDDRSPFEFSRDGAMLPRATLGEGTTTLTAVSATFSLKEAVNYAREIDSDALTYDTQLKRFPGKPPGSENDPDIELHLANDYVSKRRAQKFAFYYLLDTRGVEVVPARENHAFNREAINNRQPGSKTWFPDAQQGHISVSRRGFSAQKIWLVDSNLTRAAKVGDIYQQTLIHSSSSTQSHADDIEARTWAGQLNRQEYDALIDEVALAGKPVLNLPTTSDVFSNNIVFAPDPTDAKAT